MGARNEPFQSPPVGKFPSYQIARSVVPLAPESTLQRRLRIGYTRADRIMEILEERGVVGPNQGAEPREILNENAELPTIRVESVGPGLIRWFT